MSRARGQWSDGHANGRGQATSGSQMFDGNRRGRQGQHPRFQEPGMQQDGSFRGQGRGGRGRGGRGAAGRGRMTIDSAGHSSQGASALPPSEPIKYGGLVRKTMAERHELLLELNADGNCMRPHLLNGRLHQDEPDFVDVLLAVLCRALECRSAPLARAKLLEFLAGSDFMSSAVYERLLAGRTEHADLVWPAVRRYLTVAESLVTSEPQRGRCVVQPVLLELQRQLAERAAAGQGQPPDDCERLLQRVAQLVDDARMRITQTPQQEPSTADGHSEDTDNAPPENFRELEIFPSASDLRPANLYLRANKTEGGYDDCEHYLDVQFRLLREDFMAPLRQGVQQYLEQLRVRQKFKRLTDVTVFPGVAILNPVSSKDGVIYRIRFDASKVKHLKQRLAGGRCLIYGSLLCLSADNYETVYIATIAEGSDRPRTIHQLTDIKRGELLVKFEGTSAAEIEALDYRALEFTMVESRAYFEAYRHVLEGMKEIASATFPFQSYIVRCSRANARPPAYLPERAVCKYNLTCIEAAEKKCAESWSSELRWVPILSPDDWPDMAAIGLDQSQTAALRLALTSEFSLIQGPPGTGKTYIGLKIVQVLLANQSMWRQNRPALESSRGSMPTCPPILVVCYTNHALDQFMEGILDRVGEGLVRIGSRCSSERLKALSIATLRNRLQPPSKEMRHHYGRLQKEHSDRQRKSAVLARKVAKDDSRILSCRELGPAIPERHAQQLVRAPRQGDPAPGAELLFHWLDIKNVLQPNPPGSNAAGAEVYQGSDDDDRSSSDDDDDVDMLDMAHVKQERKLDESDDDDGGYDDRNGDDDGGSDADADGAPLGGGPAAAWAVGGKQLEDPGPGPPTDDGGQWQVVSHQRNFSPKRLLRKLHQTKAMTDEEEKHVYNIWKLSVNDRWRLYMTWAGRHHKKLCDKLVELCRDHDRVAREINELRLQRDIEVIRNAKVVGMTTTGAAKYRFVLQQVMPRVVIVEEAAEVLEAHIVTTLSPGCEHLILIGDHMQLRPNTTVYELAKEYKLDVSLFERMVKNNIPYQRLLTQHRMRPEISAVMRHIYSDLNDHDKVKKYKDIKGMKHNMFYLSHDKYEEENDVTSSRSNLFEASFVVALCRYLLQQGYGPEQVTILAPYNGQVQLLRQLLGKLPLPTESSSRMKVTSVDNYQGEENDIVLLSLVRSNIAGSLGFTNISNRVCVALSRARMGLYVFGNFEMLATCSSLWKSIVDDVEKTGRLGAELELVCQIHGRVTAVADGADFLQKAAEGGCSLECGIRLACGHTCSRRCHPFLSDHDKVECMKPCTHVFEPCGHRCRRACSADCGDYCREPIYRRLECGHEEPVPCGITVSAYQCQHKCTRQLPCGHDCRGRCGEPCKTRCLAEVTRTYACGHHVTAQCQQTEDEAPCQQPCETALQCGHPCQGTCGQCVQGRLHVPCEQPCRRILVCGHECEASCCDACPPCQRPCENRCVHSKCGNMCGAACVPCKEPCAWRCDHYSCSRLCHEPCDRPRCDAPCDHQVACSACGVQAAPCMGVCGEPCPALCGACIRQHVPVCLGAEDEADARFLQLSDCRHVMEACGMDHWMDMAAVTDGPSASASVQLKACPYCKATVRCCLRYGVLTNGLLEDVEKVKAIVRGDNKAAAARLAALCTRVSSSVISALNLRQLKDIDCRHVEVLEFQAKCLTEVDRLSIGDDAPQPPEEPALAVHVDRFRRFVVALGRSLSGQQREDAHYELYRLDGLVTLARAQRQLAGITAAAGATSTSSSVAVLRAAVLLAARLLDGRVDRQTQQELEQRAMPTLRRHCGITREEKDMIMKAMAFGSTGHWYKCPNGHIYSIGECGGAMVEATCPECKCKIGGQSHALRGDNAVATEMDGATHPAWSEANNLHAYDLDV